MENKQNIILIKKPYIEQKGNKSFLYSNITIKNKNYKMFFSVNKEYGNYLVDDRSDAFIVALLTYAMKENLDIISEAPVSRKLLYQLNQYLITMLSSNMKDFHQIKVKAVPTDRLLKNKGAVCTGWTGGVDSMYTLMTNLNRQEKNFNLTHLAIFNNGALESTNNEELLENLVAKAKSGIAKECGLEVIRYKYKYSRNNI